MDEHIIWREKLKRLIGTLGRGGIRRVADAIDKNPTYVSRMLSDPLTSQHRVVTHETCYLITKAFPRWLDDDPSLPGSAENKNKLNSKSVVYEVRPKTKRQRAIDSLLEAVDKINDDGLERLIERAAALSESHPVYTKQRQL